MSLSIIFLIFICVYYLSGYFLEKRPGRQQDRFPQIRVLAKTRDTLRAMGFSESMAIFCTEVLSGLIHAMAMWGTINLIKPLQSHALLAGAFVFILWLGIGLGQAIATERRVAARKRKDAAGRTVEAAVEDFLKNPIPCLLPHSQATSSAWSEHGCADLYVRSNGVHIGYVHNINFDYKKRIVTIGHFAVAEGLERRGIGWRLVHALRSEFAFRFNATEVRFQENSTKYFKAGYEDFFVSLGATPVKCALSNRPDWHWKI